MSQIQTIIDELGIPACVVTPKRGDSWKIVALSPQFASGQKNAFYLNSSGMTKTEIVSEVQAWWQKHSALYFGETRQVTKQTTLMLKPSTLVTLRDLAEHLDLYSSRGQRAASASQALDWLADLIGVMGIQSFIEKLYRGD